MNRDLSLRSRYGPWALVTGAARGLGAEFARQIAREGLSLVLVDTDSDGLADVGRELRDGCHVDVDERVVDLAGADAVRQLLTEVEDVDLGLLVSNAAESSVGRFLELPVDAQLRSVAVNCAAPLLLTHGIGARMVRRGRGGMVLLSSLSAFQGTPLVASYAATKAFNLVLAESLWSELAGLGVDVLAVAPGPIWTPGFRSSSPRTGWSTSLLTAQTKGVVAEALQQLGRGPTRIPGRLNRLSHRLQTLVGSRKLSTTLFGAGVRRLYPDR